jgi:hypothetical protein
MNVPALVFPSYVNIKVSGGVYMGGVLGEVVVVVVVVEVFVIFVLIVKVTVFRIGGFNTNV